MSVKTVPAHLINRVACSPTTAAFWRLTERGWESEDWQSVLIRVRNLSGHLMRLGLAHGDPAVLMMPTSIEWEIAHLAALAAGCVVIGIDAHDTQENIRHILSTVPPKALFVSTQEQQEFLSNLLPTPAPVAILNAAAAGTAAHSLQDLLSTFCEVPAQWPEVQPGQLATIIFTSGSTGRPKGIAYSHEQLCLACEAILARFGTIGEGARFACWLPLSNLFQRIINLCGIIRGGESYFVEKPTEIIDRLPEIRPSLFIGVPRFFEKLHAGIETNLASKPAWVRQGVRWARRVGMDYRRKQRVGRPAGALLTATYRVADAVFLSRIRKLAGPDLQFMVSGSAPLPVWLMESFHAMGWLVLEAYGTSENVVPIAINAPDAYRFGSVGRPLPQNELKFGEDGELLVRGKGVFSAYLGESAERAPLDSEGFLHTGDFARLDEDGYLWLVGRKSEVFKTSTGRRIAPAPIEAVLKRLHYVEHALVTGRNQPVPIALLSLNPASIPDVPQGEEPLPDKVIARIGADVASVCAMLPERDRPAGIVVTRRAFSIAGGELTSNLKLKRGIIEAKFLPDMDALCQALKNERRYSHPLIMEAS
jgi:long-chain acyl-CoA synthetase